METTLNIVLPIFGLIACGYGLAKTPVLSAEGVRGLNGFVYYVAIPALLFRTIVKGVPADAFDPSILLAYFGGAGTVFVISMFVGRAISRLSLAEQAVMGMGGAFGNTVMMGIPLVLTAFGDAGITPITIIIAFNATIFFTATTILIEISRGHREQTWPTLAAAAGGLIKNPVLLALAAGAIWKVTGLSIPAAGDRFISLLSAAAPAMALGGLGASLTQFKIAGNIKDTLVMTALKLLLQPLLVWLLGRYVFGLSPTWLAVAVIAASMPIGSNVFILAQQYETFTARAASGVLISTILSVVTVTIVVGLFVT